MRLLAPLVFLAGFCWLAGYALHRYPPESDFGRFVDAAILEAEAADEAHAHQVGGGLYLTAEDKAHAIDDWNTMFRSCRENPDCSLGRIHEAKGAHGSKKTATAAR